MGDQVDEEAVFSEKRAHCLFSVASNYPKSHLSAPSLFSDTAQTVLVGLLFSMVAGNVPSGAQRQIESYLVAF
jgi:hypothetical protein